MTEILVKEYTVKIFEKDIFKIKLFGLTWKISKERKIEVNNNVERGNIS